MQSKLQPRQPWAIPPLVPFAPAPSEQPFPEPTWCYPKSITRRRLHPTWPAPQSRHPECYSLSFVSYLWPDHDNSLLNVSFFADMATGGRGTPGQLARISIPLPHCFHRCCTIVIMEYKISRFLHPLFPEVVVWKMIQDRFCCWNWPMHRISVVQFGKTETWFL